MILFLKELPKTSTLFFFKVHLEIVTLVSKNNLKKIENESSESKLKFHERSFYIWLKA